MLETSVLLLRWGPVIRGMSLAPLYVTHHSYCTFDTPNLRFKMPLTIGQRSTWVFFLSIFAYLKCSGEKRRENHVYSLIKNKIIALFQPRLVS